MYARQKLASPGTGKAMLIQYTDQHELQNQPKTRVSILLANLHRKLSQHINTMKKDYRCMSGVSCRSTSECRRRFPSGN